MRVLVAVLLLALAGGQVWAQPVPPQPEPFAAALIQMLQEAQQREAMALTRAIVAERQVQAAQARAAAAEAKLGAGKP